MTRHAPLRLEKPDVIVVGESLTDIVVQTKGSSIEHPGGSPANVAYGLARLGIPTGFLTSIGNDDRGAALVAHLIGAGVQILAGSQSSLERAAGVASAAAAITVSRPGAHLPTAEELQALLAA
jgi:fructokinase